MRNTIMTEKIARRGVRVPAEYHADYHSTPAAAESSGSAMAVATKEAIALFADQTIEEVLRLDQPRSQRAVRGIRDSLILNRDTNLIAGVLTRRDLLAPDKQEDTKIGELIHSFPRVVYEDLTLRDAANHMVNHDIGRLPVVTRAQPGRVVGMITRSDILGAHRARLTAANDTNGGLRGSHFRVAPEPQHVG